MWNQLLGQLWAARLPAARSKQKRHSSRALHPRRGNKRNMLTACSTNAAAAPSTTLLLSATASKRPETSWTRHWTKQIWTLQVSVSVDSLAQEVIAISKDKNCKQRPREWRQRRLLVPAALRNLGREPRQLCQKPGELHLGLTTFTSKVTLTSN